MRTRGFMGTGKGATMGGISGVNHVASMAKDMGETVRFYEEILDVPVRRIVNDEPGRKHYSLDLGGEGTLDFFEAPPGTGESTRDTLGALNHLAVTATPAFIDEVEKRLQSRGVSCHPSSREGQKTIYFSDPNGINLQLYPATGGTRG